MRGGGGGAGGVRRRPPRGEGGSQPGERFFRIVPCPEENTGGLGLSITHYSLPRLPLPLPVALFQVCQQALATLLALCHAPANRHRLAALGVEPRVRALLRSGAFPGPDSAAATAANAVGGGDGGKGSPGKSPKKKRNNNAKGQPSVAARLCDALQVGMK